MREQDHVWGVIDGRLEGAVSIAQLDAEWARAVVRRDKQDQIVEPVSVEVDRKGSEVAGGFAGGVIDECIGAISLIQQRRSDRISNAIGLAGREEIHFGAVVEFACEEAGAGRLRLYAGIRESGIDLRKRDGLGGGEADGAVLRVAGEGQAED